MLQALRVGIATDSTLAERPQAEAPARARSTPEIVACLGMSFWKRARIADFLREGGRSPRFFRRAAAAVRYARERGGAVAVWGSREPPELSAQAAAASVPVLRVEDGFLRSIGLGADFIPGASIVLDSRGLYYDPSRPSDLEVLLNEAPFDAALLQRARKLIERIAAAGLTKYNVGGAMPPLAARADQRRLFVPGQVEDDCSVVMGGGGRVRGNLELLKRVRAANPDGFILYKPHPDVDAGHRRGAIADDDALRYADQIVRGASSAAIIGACDEIHTLTSLAGFEALLRGRRVVVYGRPFYAGWGLTEDRLPQLRRQRRLSVEALAAAALILYPRYLDPLTRRPCTPEQLIERLGDRRAWAGGPMVALRRSQGALRRRLRELRLTR